jgi:tRNA(adenine34) deaminase
VYDLLRDRRLPHRVEVFAGVEEEACARLLTEFFETKR